jgi:hypothetical protein
MFIKTIINTSKLSSKLSLLSFFLHEITGEWFPLFHATYETMNANVPVRVNGVYECMLRCGLGRAGPHSALWSLYDSLHEHSNAETKKGHQLGSIWHRCVGKTGLAHAAVNSNIYMNVVSVMNTSCIYQSTHWLGAKFSILFRPSSLLRSCHPPKQASHLLSLLQTWGWLAIWIRIYLVLLGAVRIVTREGQRKSSYPIHVHLFTCLHESQMIAGVLIPFHGPIWVRERFNVFRTGARLSSSGGQAASPGPVL